jgi:hypothetical protein
MAANSVANSNGPRRLTASGLGASYHIRVPDRGRHPFSAPRSSGHAGKHPTFVAVPTGRRTRGAAVSRDRCVHSSREIKEPAHSAVDCSEGEPGADAVGHEGFTESGGHSVLGPPAGAVRGNEHLGIEKGEVIEHPRYEGLEQRPVEVEPTD